MYLKIKIKYKKNRLNQILKKNLNIITLFQLRIHNYKKKNKFKSGFRN